MKRKVVTALMCTVALGSMMAMSASAEGKLVGYTCMDGTNPFFVALQGAIQEVVEENGDEGTALGQRWSHGGIRNGCVVTTYRIWIYCL